MAIESIGRYGFLVEPKKNVLLRIAVKCMPLSIECDKIQSIGERDACLLKPMLQILCCCKAEQNGSGSKYRFNL